MASIEEVVSALEARGAFWEDVGFVGAVLVVVGIVLEEIGDSARLKSRPWVKRLGFWLLILGLLAETDAHARLSKVSSEIVAVFSRATSEAAERVEELARENRRLRHRTAMARRSEKADRAYHRERVQSSALHTPWRAFTGESRAAFNRMLEGKPKATVLLVYASTDEESRRFAEELREALGANGWNVQPNPVEHVSQWGISLHSSLPYAEWSLPESLPGIFQNAITASLGEHRLTGGGVLADIPADVLHVYVGRRY